MVIQLVYDTVTCLQQAADPPRRPQRWVAIALFTVTVRALLLPLAVKQAHSVRPSRPAGRSSTSHRHRSPDQTTPAPGRPVAGGAGDCQRRGSP